MSLSRARAAGASDVMPPASRARRRGRVTVAVILAVGIVLSSVAGMLWGRSIARSERQTFNTAATPVAETAEMLVDQDEEFVTSLRAGLTNDPTMSAGEFARWLGELEGRRHGLGGLGTVLVHSVVRVAGATPAPGLSAELQGLLTALTGVLLTGLLAALTLTLASSRERALGLVDQKTGELQHQALHDALTGLPNRVGALDRAKHMLARARREQAPVAALYVDLDGFKHVNDTFGHAAGDEVLKIVAQRLQSVVREGDTAAHLGSDEFVVLVEDGALAAGPQLVAERVLEVLRQPYELGGEVGRELTLTASIGLAWGKWLTADELLRDADLALYQAKAAGRNRCVAFEREMEAAARERSQLELDLARALEHRELFLLYQPTVDLRSERVIGVEALVRWRHAERGVIGPDRFIPLAEQTGLIVPIGAWVLREACRQAATWRAAGLELTSAVNVSARQLDTGSLLDEVGNTLHMETLAEGIETREQLLTLQREHCDQGQGYLFARPLPADEIEQLIEHRDAPTHSCLI